MSVNWCNQCAYQSKIPSEGLKRVLSYDPGTLLLGKHKEISLSYYGDTTSAMFILSITLFTIVRNGVSLDAYQLINAQ